MSTEHVDLNTNDDDDTAHVRVWPFLTGVPWPFPPFFSPQIQRKTLSEMRNRLLEIRGCVFKKKKEKNITAVDAPHCSRPSGAYSTNNPLTHCEPAERGHQASSVLAQLGLSGHHSHPFTRDPIEGGLYHIPIGEREVDHQSMTHCKNAFDYSLVALTPHLGIGDTS